MTNRAGATLSYDAENRLTQDVTASSTITNTYNGDGQRVKTTVSAGGTATNTYDVGNYYEVMVVGDNTTTTKYYFFGAQRIAMRVGNSNTVSYLYGDHPSTSLRTGSGQHDRDERRDQQHAGALHIRKTARD